MFSSFIIESWDETIDALGPMLKVRIYAPSHWNANHFLEVVEESFIRQRVTSLMKGFTLDEVKYPYIIINTIQYEFFPIIRIRS